MKRMSTRRLPCRRSKFVDDRSASYTAADESSTKRRQAWMRASSERARAPPPARRRTAPKERRGKWDRRSLLGGGRCCWIDFCSNFPSQLHADYLAAGRTSTPPDLQYPLATGSLGRVGWCSSETRPSERGVGYCRQRHTQTRACAARRVPMVPRKIIYKIPARSGLVAAPRLQSLHRHDDLPSGCRARAGQSP